MRPTFYQKLIDTVSQHIDFYKSWTSNPIMVGAIAPTGMALARKMASVIHPDSNMPILELGPGTGVVTKLILERGIDPKRLVSIESSGAFIPGLKQRYPGVDFVHDSAFNIKKIAQDRGIHKFDTVISSLPLLNFSLIQRMRFIKTILGLLEPGRPMVQFSYGLNAPAPVSLKHYAVHHMDTVLCNLPPARLWAYRSTPQTIAKAA